MVKKSDNQFVGMVYDTINKNLNNKLFLKVLKNELTEQDVYHIKENIYNLDFWISEYFFRALLEKKIILKNDYSDLAILGIFSTIRETLFGFIIYITYLRDAASIKNTTIDTELLMKYYIQDILNTDEYYHKKLSNIINNLQADFNEIIKHWIAIDDNKDYLKIGADNRTHFTANKSLEEIKKKVISEDVIRFK